MVYTDPKFKAKDRSKKSSALSTKKRREQYKGHHKDNYKKKKSNTSPLVECCICLGHVPNTLDNSVTCGNTTHFLCGECKFRCNETGNTKCPMCRSHNIKNPVARDVEITVYENGDKIPKTKYWFKEDSMAPKVRRKFIRNGGPYESPFGQNTNRIRREISTGTGRASGRPTLYLPRRHNNQDWLSNDQVINEYNGMDLDDHILDYI
jgi:hypothetical protein